MSNVKSLVDDSVEWCSTFVMAVVRFAQFSSVVLGLVFFSCACVEIKMCVYLGKKTCQVNVSLGRCIGTLGLFVVVRELVRKED